MKQREISKCPRLLELSNHKERVYFCGNPYNPDIDDRKYVVKKLSPREVETICNTKNCKNCLILTNSKQTQHTYKMPLSQALSEDL